MEQNKALMISAIMGIFVFVIFVSTGMLLYPEHTALNDFQKEVDTLTYDDCTDLVSWLNDSHSIYDRNDEKEGIAKEAQDLFFMRYDKAVELGCSDLVGMP